MPTYEYVCKDCDPANREITEVIQKLNDPAPKCSKCSKPMRRQISTTSFVLKGTGWYKDGYR